MFFAGIGLAAESAQVEKFVKARIEIGEMMTNYFKEGLRPARYLGSPRAYLFRYLIISFYTALLSAFPS